MDALDERVHHATIATAINTELSPHFTYGYGDVPGMRSLDGQTNPDEQPNIYVLLAVQRRAATVNLRAGGARGVNPVRFSTRVVGRTRKEAQWARLKVATALDEQILSFGGLDGTPIQFENEDEIAYDDGRYAGLTRWTYQA